MSAAEPDTAENNGDDHRTDEVGIFAELFGGSPFTSIYRVFEKAGRRRHAYTNPGKLQPRRTLRSQSRNIAASTRRGAGCNSATPSHRTKCFLSSGECGDLPRHEQRILPAMPTDRPKAS